MLFGILSNVRSILAQFKITQHLALNQRWVSIFEERLYPNIIKTLAAFARTIHATSQPTVELINNIELLQQLWQALSDKTCPTIIKMFDLQINSSNRVALPTALPRRDEKIVCRLRVPIAAISDELTRFVSSLNPSLSFVCYQTLFVNGLRYSADPSNHHRKTHDGCLLYEHGENDFRIGFLLCVSCVSQNSTILLILRNVKITSTCDSLRVNNSDFFCTNVLTGHIESNSLSAIRPSQVVQKLSFRHGHPTRVSFCEQSFFFFQYPNLHECT